ncbi:MAG: hypothetical protein NZ473_03420 [Candidatus Kapabacteria bacterium]|nr:hypothetical protein [Candidatus Kapabacteria bacterium]MCS7170520.1 hypothetical protein [Candidatus Kapabacteria bacterium]MDW7996532.1 hypothetical protein [Bacteroidota bacterium]MDW8225242.1 hypothetical protein [Bacteroidota bacterium]
MDFLLTLHGHNRWLVAAAWAAALAVILSSSRTTAASPPRVAMIALSVLLGLFTLQFLLGAIVFIQKWSGWADVPHHRWEHVAMMVLALVLLHLPLRWQKRLAAARWRRRTAFILVAVGLLGFLGVARLPEGWLG